LQPILDLGRVPLANALITADRLGEPEERFPLVLYFCPDCALVQIGENVTPERLFGHYFYASSFSDTMLAHARLLADRLTDERGLGPTSLVVEVASNDGYLLQHYRNRHIPVLGIEPARNIAIVARERGIPTIDEFFDASIAQRLADDGIRADVIHAHNVLAHVPDPNGFIRGLRQLLKPDGIAVIEVPYLVDLIENLEFDTIYHEHFSYFSLMAVERICRRHGMCVRDVQRIEVHGGSLRLWISHERLGAENSVASLIAAERDRGVDDFTYYQAFSKRVWMLRDELLQLLWRLKTEGRGLAAYGASAKGSTLMNVFGIDGCLIDFVVDRSSLKQGKYTPGNHLPILSPDALLERRPEHVLLLTWNFADEILKQQEAFRIGGGRFILPLPSVKIA